MRSLKDKLIQTLFII